MSVRYTGYYEAPDGRHGEQTRALIEIGARFYGRTGLLVGSMEYPWSPGPRWSLRFKSRIASTPSRRGLARYWPKRRIGRAGWRTEWC